MLRITITDTPDEQRLVLEGKLTEPDIPELESAWEAVCAAAGTRSCVVDLRNTTFIDESGERILLAMKRQGARFIACGVFTRHQLEHLGIKCKS